MNIILINHYAGSNYHGMEFRPYYLAREWVRMGHDVTIVAASFSHLRQKNLKIRNKKEEVIDGIRYVWLPVSEYEGNTIKRFVNMLQFIRQLYKNINFFVKLRPDVVIASSTYPLDVYPAHKLADKVKAKFIFELHDLWPLSPRLLGGMSKYHPFIVLMQMAEDYWCKHADKVVSVLPKAKQYLITRGLDESKFFYIPNGIVLSDVQYIEPLFLQYEEIIQKLRKDKFLIGYAGGHAVSNALDILIDAALNLKENSSIHFVLLGNGNEKEKLQRICREQNLDNVTFLDSIPKNMVPDFLLNMDCLYIGWKKHPLYKYGISPNKLMDYMMAGKPIIHSVSAGNDLVKEANCGVSVEAEDVAGIVKAIRYLQSMPAEKRIQLGMNGKKFVMKNHDYKVLAEKFIEYLK